MSRHGPSALGVWVRRFLCGSVWADRGDAILAQGFHVKEPQTAPVQRSNSQIRRTLQQTRKDPDEHHVTVVVIHGSRRIRSQSSNAIQLYMIHNMSDMQGPPSSFPQRHPIA